MANITAAMVKELRETTSAGMMDCKTALAESNGDMEAAVDWLRKKGLAKAAKKARNFAEADAQVREYEGAIADIAVLDSTCRVLRGSGKQRIRMAPVHAFGG